MRWKRGQGRGQIEDLRGSSGRRGMGGMPFPVGVGGGLGGIGLLVVIAVMLLSSGVLGGGGGGASVDPRVDPFPQMPGAQGSEPLPGAPDPDAELVEFVGFVVDDVQDSWARLFAEAGQRYQPTTLRLFTDAIQSGCGAASAATGPFYCPLDRKVYLDLSFFRELRDRFGAPGDFAQAYVIAHEFGHHVQNVLGIADDIRRGQQEHPDEANELSVRLELQADCLAGVWAHSAYREGLLESGDLEEGLAAAAAIGDDRLQREAGRQVNPDTFTHGTSEQRVGWFRRGYESGDLNSCNTFKEDL
jgi:predicted metalloprotease